MAAGPVAVGPGPADTYSRHVGRAVAIVETSPDPNSDDDAGSDESPRDVRREASWFRHWFSDTGMGHFSGRLDPERYEALTNAIDAHTTRLANEAPESGDGGKPPRRTPIWQHQPSSIS